MYRAVGLERALQARQDSIEHLSGVVSPLGRIDPLLQMLGPRALAERVREGGTWSCVTLTLRHKLVPPERRRELLARPEMKYVSPATRASWASPRFVPHDASDAD